jgi:hypothetical protein
VFLQAIATVCWIYPLTPALSPKGARGKGSRFVRLSNLAFNSVFQVGAPCASNAVSPLSPRERGKGADLYAFQILRSTRYFKSAHHFGQSPLPPREGKREPICALFKSCVQLGISSRRNLREQRGQSPLPPREGKGSRFVRFSNLALNSVFQVGATCASNAVSPLSLWERVRVRAPQRTLRYSISRALSCSPRVSSTSR